MKSRTRSRRAAAVAFSLVAIALGAFTLVAKPLKQSGSAGNESSQITAYDVNMTLSKDGTLVTDETITVNFPVPRHGIFRIFDTEDPRRDYVEHPVDSLEVTRDGHQEPFTWIDSARGTRTARIGSPNVLIGPGTATYRLVSRTHDVLEPEVTNGRKDPDTTLWWWDVIGSGWQMPIENARIRVSLPAVPTSVECVEGESTPCTAKVDGTALSLDVAGLAPFEAVTVRVAMPSDQVPPNGSAPRGEVPLSIAAGLLGAILGLLGWWYTREEDPGFPVLYEPPAGVRPAIGVRVLDEKDSADELQATLFDLGDRGVLQIIPDGSDWRVELKGDPIAASCEPWEILMLNELGLRSVGSTFEVAKSVSAGQAISEAKKALSAGTRTYTASLLTRSAGGMLARLASWAAWLGLGAIAGFHFFGGVPFPTPLVVGLAAFAVCSSLNATDVGRSTVRTEAGRDVWSRTGGFARFLTTDSSESRFDAAANLDWFPHYLPWAVALGVSEEWARRYQAQGVEVPAVPYVYGWGYGSGWNSSRFADFNNSFNSAISSASAAYAASKVSSGGGGFSGGSGGGGGGGGSW